MSRDYSQDNDQDELQDNESEEDRMTDGQKMFVIIYTVISCMVSLSYFAYRHYGYLYR